MTAAELADVTAWKSRHGFDSLPDEYALVLMRDAEQARARLPLRSRRRRMSGEAQEYLSHRAQTMRRRITA